jgi:hypothetical protein
VHTWNLGIGHNRGTDQLRSHAAENMSSMPENRMCQIWVIHDATTPSGLLRPRRPHDRRGCHHLYKKTDPTAVAVEPAGGLEKPTGEPVLLTEL